MKYVLILALLISTQAIAQNKKKISASATATFGEGCFSCAEAFFQCIKGVEKVAVGYSGGKTENPTSKDISTGETGHAEVLQITYNPKVVSYEDLLEVFWNTHDPSTLNKQGDNSGTQYRSVVFYHNDEQKKTAEQYKAQLEKAGTFSKIVTEITPFTLFYPAEDSYQNFYNLNPQDNYCQTVIRPKVEKFKKRFGNKLKAEK